MLSLRIGLAPSLAIAVTLLPAVVNSSRPAKAQVPANTPTGALPVTQLKVTSNLVVVRVVVRDAQGKPVMGLRKEDFRLFDSGKQQPITQFEAEPGIEPSWPLPSQPLVSHGSKPEVTATPPALPGRFLALYFDDLFTTDSDIPQIRQAAKDYLAANLQPADRVAIFTSGQMLSDFTSDPKQIQDALARLKSTSRAPALGHDCPDLTDYQALEITNTAARVDIKNPWPTGDAWGLALEEASDRDCLPTMARDYKHLQAQEEIVTRNYIVGKAAALLGQVESLTSSNLRELEQVVKYTAQMPGQRTVIFASPGFLLLNENQFHLERLIDQALRFQVVISALDPRGLVVIARQADASQIYIPGGSGTAAGAMHRMDQNREVVAQDALAQLAEGTGGEFFHNNNDLKAGFARLSGSGGYILTFAPKDLKPNGKLHPLKITLAEKHTGYNIQARRGYYAPRNEAEAKAWAAEAEASGRAGQTQEQIREALLSRAEITWFPVVLDMKVAEGQGETHELSLSSHVDPKFLHFHKEADHSRNTLTFVFGVFDQKGNMLTAQQRHATVDVTDAQMPEFLKAGIDLGMTFQLPPGNYWIREVVTDTDQRLSAMSRNVKIPKVIPATTAASPPPVASRQAPASAQVNPQAQAPRTAIVASNIPPPPSSQPPPQASAVQAAKQQPTAPPASDPATRKLLLEVWSNFVQYLSSIPNVFADEHVVSTATAAYGSQARQGVHDSEMQSVTDSTIDSVFRLKRLSTDGKTVDLVESREIKDVDHQPAAKGQSLVGPAILVGAFSRAPNIFSPELKDCFDYRLLPNMHRRPGESLLFLHAEVLVLEYALKSPLPAKCPEREQTSGRAYIDPGSMQIVRLEQQRPRHNEGTKLPTSWSWYIDYERVMMDGKPYWLPKTIASKASSLDGGRYKWSFLANYSNYHLMTITSTMLPTANTSQR